MREEKQTRELSANKYNVGIVKLITIASILQLPVVAHANGAPAPGWRTTVTAGYAVQGDSDLENRGEFSVDRSILQIETARRFGQKLFAGGSISYGESRYSFSPSGVAAPWEDIRNVQFGLSLRYLASEKWSLFGFPILSYRTERDADLSEGREYGLIAGASYRFSETLSLGPGLGAFSGIGDEEDFFPILLINWKMTDTLSLETGRGLAISRGPGLSLKWQPVSQWRFGIAARYEKSRFRLDDAAGNIGEDKSVPVLLTARWEPSRKFTLSALAGVETSGTLTLEDNAGNRLDRLSYDSAPIAGLVAAFKF